MKNLRVVIVLFLMIITLSVNAQFKIGAKGGINFANVSGIDSPLSEINGLTGFNAGVMTELKFVKIGVEADVLYSRKGFNMDITSGFPISSFSSEISLDYIDIPVVAKLYFIEVINLQAGVEYSYLLNATTKIDGFGDRDSKDDFNSNDFSAIVGFGIDVNRFHMSTRYYFGITNINQGDAKNQVLQISIGFWIKK